ncbi:MAG: hypothetical protein CM1200mP9_05280 [Gammaproteobacteria bacterium]|nr:MAG: hypothetical protein CM1200mP9_05280 [Gammaproteobacteria bacterium]
MDIHEVELVNVNFAYDTAVPVLRDINLTRVKVKPSPSSALPVAGKARSLNPICRFYQPTSGHVFIDSIDYRNRSLHWLQSNLGVVLQNAHVFEEPS